MIKAAIFDMDGLLIDSEPLWCRALNDVFKRMGIHGATAKDWKRMWGRRTDEALGYMYERYPWDGPSVKEVADMIDEAVVDLIKKEAAMKHGVHSSTGIC